MKKLLLAFVLCLGLPSVALAQKTKAALTTEVNTKLAGGTTAITASLLRATLIDVINSYYDLNGLTTVSCGSNTFVTSFPTLSSVTCTQPSVSDISGFGTGVATWLATPSGANLLAALTTKTGTGLPVFGTSPNITTPTGIVKGDVGLGNVANVDTTNASNISSGTLATARGGAAAAGQLPGTATNDSACAGCVGELKTTTAASNAVSLTTGTAANCVTLALTAGDWAVSGTVFYVGAGTTTVSYAESTVNITSATRSQATSNTFFGNGVAYFGSINGSGFTVSAPAQDVKVTGTPNVFLVGFMNFGVSTATCGGTINAWRVR